MGNIDPFAYPWPERRKVLLSMIESYTEDGLVLHECLQNAADSFFDIDKKSFVKNDSAKISISFNLEHNIIEISDNGTGIKIDNFEYLMKTHSSPKGAIIEAADELNSPIRRALKGSQGVGLKLSMLCSEEFKLATTFLDGEGNYKSWEIALEKWHDKLLSSEEGHELRVDIPEVSNSENKETGTTVTYRIDRKFKIGDAIFDLKRFILELIYTEFERRNYVFDDNDNLVIKAQFKDQDDYDDKVGIAELLASAMKYSPNPAYLLDLNPIIISKRNEGFEKEKDTLTNNKKNLELLVKTIPSDQEKRLADAKKQLVEAELLLNILQFKSKVSELEKKGEIPPRIELNVSIKGVSADDLHEELIQHIKIQSGLLSTEISEDENSSEDKIGHEELVGQDGQFNEGITEVIE